LFRPLTDAVLTQIRWAVHAEVKRLEGCRGWDWVDKYPVGVRVLESDPTRVNVGFEMSQDESLNLAKNVLSKEDLEINVIDLGKNDSQHGDALGVLCSYFAEMHHCNSCPIRSSGVCDVPTKGDPLMRRGMCENKIRAWAIKQTKQEMNDG